MEKDYTDIEKTSLAEYAVALKQTEDKVLEALRQLNLQDLKKYIKLYFQLSKLNDKKHTAVMKENNRKLR